MRGMDREKTFVDQFCLDVWLVVEWVEVIPRTVRYVSKNHICLYVSVHKGILWSVQFNCLYTHVYPCFKEEHERTD